MVDYDKEHQVSQFTDDHSSAHTSDSGSEAGSTGEAQSTAKQSAGDGLLTNMGNHPREALLTLALSAPAHGLDWLPSGKARRILCSKETIVAGIGVLHHYAQANKRLLRRKRLPAQWTEGENKLVYELADHRIEMKRYIQDPHDIEHQGGWLASGAMLVARIHPMS